jgi:beta-N-acetylhexosaminidase
MGRADVPGELVSLFFDDMARSLADLGINLNLAPVVDLDFGRGSPVIGRLERAFSSDPAVVANRARLFVRAHRRHGIATTLKHFPGHGSALRDSHDGLPDVSEVWVEAELRPFAALIRSAHADSVMLAHLVHPRLSDASRRPTSLSATAVNALRLQLGFDGPILTDALDMEAITGEFSVEEAAVEAIMSGVDVVIVAADRNPRPTAASELHAALIDAFEAGRLDPVGIAASCRRIASWRAALAQ